MGMMPPGPGGPNVVPGPGFQGPDASMGEQAFPPMPGGPGAMPQGPPPASVEQVGQELLTVLRDEILGAEGKRLAEELRARIALTYVQAYAQLVQAQETQPETLSADQQMQLEMTKIQQSTELDNYKAQMEMQQKQQDFELRAWIEQQRLQIQRDQADTQAAVQAEQVGQKAESHQQDLQHKEEQHKNDLALSRYEAEQKSKAQLESAKRPSNSK